MTDIRTGTIWIKTGTDSLAKIIVKQAQPQPPQPEEKYFYFNTESATTAETTIDSTATTVDVQYLSNYASSDLIYNYDESISSWITDIIFIDNGDKTGKIRINFNNNLFIDNRKCNIKILNNDSELGTLTLTQNGKYPCFMFLKVGQGSSENIWYTEGTEIGPEGIPPLDATSTSTVIRVNTRTSGYTNNFNITTDTPTMFYGFENYIVQPYSDVGNIYASYYANTSSTPRTGSIIIKHGATLMAKVTITQNGKTDNSE